MSVFKIDSIRVMPGEKMCTRLPVTNGLLPDGSKVEIPIIILNGMKKGPVFTVFAAVHGGEVTGTPAIINVSKDLDPQSLSGTLIGIPAANPLAFITQTRGWIMDEPQALKNLNRVFPGKIDGTITQRIAYTIFNQIILRSTVTLDFHTWGYGVPMVGYRYGFGELSRKSFELADVSATKLILKESIHHGTTHTEGAKHGIVTVNAETMGGLPMPALEEHIKLWEKTMINIMKKLDMVEGEPDFPEHIYIEIMRETANYLLGKVGTPVRGELTTIKPIKNPGFMIPYVKLMDRVSKNQKLASIINLFGEEVEAIYSPCDDGIVTRIRRNVVQPGDNPIGIAHIIDREDMFD